MRTPPRTLIALLALVSAPALAGSIEPPVLRVSLENEPPTLDWNAHRQASDRFLVSFLMRGLLKYDAQSKPVCDLCAKYEVSPDGKAYTFEFPGGQQWSDGVPLKAQHFADSLNRLMAKGNHFRAAQDFRSVSSVLAPDATHLEIRLSRPELGFAFLLTTSPAFPIRKELLSGPKDSGERHASTAVLGPYQLAEWARGKRIVIEGNPHYQGERPVYRVDFVEGTHEKLLEKFRAGRLDILASPTTEDLMKLPGQGMQVSP
ncbi:MAG: ABC transporter substrate-binding protein, partial [Bdellovibrionota bacterium]